MLYRKIVFTAASLMSLTLALSLSGCSSAPSGPTKTDIAKVLAQYSMLSSDRFVTKADYANIKKFYMKQNPYMHIQECKKTGISTWTCSFYFKFPQGHGPQGRASMEMHHFGHKWTYVSGSYKPMGLDD